MTIWKYMIGLRDTQHVRMPLGSRPLSAQVQRGELCVWVLCDLDAPMTTYIVNVAMTGGEAPPNVHRSAFVGTVQMSDAFVVHVFMRPESV